MQGNQVVLQVAEFNRNHNCTMNFYQSRIRLLHIGTIKNKFTTCKHEEKNMMEIDIGILNEKLVD